ncbi:hypothetical protein [Gaoshiqia sediminis]|uniref:Uncharacterized protein n=1 Tax=Gaoshiqia sediminis TaxID=2986998 RepID=A0AA41Y1E2_9BACT|nr:hypothetical protein [Gaoshiqia sediminis]MCW0481679.1 hypothetical protein [Gaoshiqia sediminis]
MMEYNWRLCLLLFAILLGVGISCNKDRTDYPITYTSRVVQEAGIRVFTRNGEIISQPLKDEVISRCAGFLPELEEIDVAEVLQATYLSCRSVELIIDQVPEEKARTVNQVDDIIYWENPDSALIENGFLFNGSNNLLAYYPFYYREIPIPTPSGFTTVIMARHCYYVEKEKENLHVPMLDMILKWGSEPYECYPAIGINNALKEGGYTGLAGTDTLIVRDYVLVMTPYIR